MHTSKITRLLNPKEQILSLFLLFLIHWIRTMPLLIGAEFWMEDGAVFFQEAYNLGIHTIYTPYHGYLHTAIRIVALSGLIVPIELIPVTYTLIAALLQFVPIVYLLSGRLDMYFPNKLLLLVFSIVYILCPIGYETYGSITNIQWYLPFLALILLYAAPPIKPWVQNLEYILLVILVLTGPFVVFYALAVGVVWLLYRYRPTKMALGILTMGILVQGYFLWVSDSFTGGMDDTGIRPDIWLYVRYFPGLWVYKTVIGATFGDILLTLLRGNTKVGFQSVPLIIAGLTLWLALGWQVWRSRNPFLAALLIVTTLTTISGFHRMFGHLLVGNELLNGERYFLSIAVMWLFLLYFAWHQVTSSYRWIFGALFLMACLVGIPSRFHYDRSMYYTTSWSQQVEQFFATPPDSSHTFQAFPTHLGTFTVKRQLGQLPLKTQKPIKKQWPAALALDIPIKTSHHWIAQPDLITINNGWAFVEGLDATQSQIYLVFEDPTDQTTISFKAAMAQRPDVVMAFENNPFYFNTGFGFKIPTKYIPKQKAYEVYLYIEHPQGYAKSKITTYIKETDN